MRSSLTIKVAVLVVGVVLSFIGHTKTALAANGPISVFEISPRACVAQYQGQTCELKVKVKWQSKAKLNVCFTQQKKQLKCWRDSSGGSAVVAVSLQETSEFALYNEHNQKLAKHTITMNFVKNYRRPLKPRWSIF